MLAARLLPWFDEHGRRHLPWQANPTPYRVWISEVMLQQTQVETVAPYFARFTRRFPDVGALASASLDDVLHLWSGLGYYARARNLHRAAREIVARHGGALPAALPELMALPGIGRSTGGAILALAHGQRHPILDGNVKRVLTRVFDIREWPGAAHTAARLWRLAEDCTPATRVAAYTQAIMDLGATVCTRTSPACRRCPLEDGCAALAADCVELLPARRPRAEARRLRRTQLVFVLRNGAEVMLRRRAPQGIWGGLWAPPEFPDATAARHWCVSAFDIAPAAMRRLPTLRHTFTHFDLDIEPWVVRLRRDDASVQEPGTVWYNYREPSSIGLAAPIIKLIGACFADDGGAMRESKVGKNGPMRRARPRGGRPRSRALSG
jgi:A/G-specific adenine glycosylase